MSRLTKRQAILPAVELVETYCGTMEVINCFPDDRGRSVPHRRPLIASCGRCGARCRALSKVSAFHEQARFLAKIWCTAALPSTAWLSMPFGRPRRQTT